MIPLSVLDLVPVCEGSGPREAMEATAQLAQCAEQQGYKRFWIAEHHGMDGIGGGATASNLVPTWFIQSLFPVMR